MLTIKKINFRNKPRVKRSPIWKISSYDFNKIVKESGSFGEILKKCNVSSVGGNIHTLKRRLNEENIDYSHIPTGKSSNKGRKFNVVCLDYDDLFVVDCKHSRSALKNYIIKNNIIPYKCSECGLTNTWHGKDLVLVLDHINGIRNDNRIENLRFLCPNCNSQQDTFAGRNNKLYDTKYYCLDCHKEISKTSLRCQSCAGIELKKDISKRPDKETLIKDITLMSMVKVGKKYGVSDNAVKKWCKFYGIWHLRKNKK